MHPLHREIPIGQNLIDRVTSLIPYDIKAATSPSIFLQTINMKSFVYSSIATSFTHFAPYAFAMPQAGGFSVCEGLAECAEGAPLDACGRPQPNCYPNCIRGMKGKNPDGTFNFCRVPFETRFSFCQSITSVSGPNNCEGFTMDGGQVVVGTETNSTAPASGQTSGTAGGAVPGAIPGAPAPVPAGGTLPGAPAPAPAGVPPATGTDQQMA